jgi:hypothetical protein
MGNLGYEIIVIDQFGRETAYGSGSLPGAKSIAKRALQRRDADRAEIYKNNHSTQTQKLLARWYK